MALAGVGVVGFFLSFGQVASPAQAATDVHDTLPVLAYAAILLWAGGLAIMWYSRRWLDFAVRRKKREDRAAMVVDLAETGEGPVDGAELAMAGRDPVLGMDGAAPEEMDA
jgi:NhaP-type Na+/H+ or K+/H+ antiporter